MIKKKNTILKLVALFFLPATFTRQAVAQYQEIFEKPIVYKNTRPPATDTTSLWAAIRRSQLTGRVRYTFMTTQNEKGLSDYYSNAIGAGVRFETGSFLHFQFAVSVFATFNIGSSNFNKTDSITGQYSRYEIGNFDINDPANKFNIKRLEEFYLKYSIRNSFVKAGRQFINSTFINLQDGRMSPTDVAGIWSEINEIKKVRLHAGWLWGVSPRSTTQWYTPGQSIGVYAAGVDPDGITSGYVNNVKSNNVGLLEVSAEVIPRIKLQLAELYISNVLNTTMLQADYTYVTKNKSSLFVDLQVIKQYSINNGGNTDQTKTYFPKGAQSLSHGARLGWRKSQWETTFNYTRITSQGRYLVPREWGKDPFFTFMPRERNEGFGDVHAIMSKVSYVVKKTAVSTSLSAGYFHLPDVKNYALNKYGLPSYTQVNAEAKYVFSKALKGLEIQALVVNKHKIGETYGNKKFEINKVNMMQYNLIMNYYF